MSSFLGWLLLIQLLMTVKLNSDISTQHVYLGPHINFDEIVHPTCLYGTTRLLGPLEYHYEIYSQDRQSIVLILQGK